MSTARKLAAVAAPPGDRLVDVLAQLEPADAAWLADMLADPPWWRVRQQRLAERDELIRQAVRSLGSCRAMAAELAHYIGTAWRRERDLAELPETASQHRRRLHFGDRDECVGGNLPKGGVMPAKQRLIPVDCPINNQHHRLKCQPNLAALERRAEIGFQLAGLLGFSVRGCRTGRRSDRVS